MIVQFRDDVETVLQTVTSLQGAIWREIPDDVAVLPCAVIGRPDIIPGDPGLSDMSLDVWVIGNRNDAGETETEHDQITDDVFAAFGGTTGVQVDPNRTALSADSIQSRTTEIAGVVYPVYTVAVESTVHTC